MSYRPDSFVAGPQTSQHDPTWQLHSSTDSYLHWDANTKSPSEQHPPRSSTASAAPAMSRLRSASSAASTSAPGGQMPAEPQQPDSASVVSHHGHTTSPERSVSPSYFTKLYFQAPNRSSSGTSPTITFTGAPAEPSLLANAQTPPPLPDGIQPTSQLADPTRDAMANRRPSITAVASGPATTAAIPLSPTLSTRSAASGGGFFASLRPSSPGNLSISTSSRTQDGEASVKPRRPSSVFEHVGNVWERFGRKVHHTRTATSEQQPSLASHPRRSASQASPPIGLTPESADAFDTARTSPSDSFISQASPSQSTTTDSECRTPATPSGEPPASIPTPQPLPSAPAYTSIPSHDALANAPQQDEVEELPYLAPESPESSQIQSAGPVVGSPRIASGHRSVASHRRTSSLFERVLIQVTDDNERFSVVDISGVDSADAIKERMFAKLHLFEADHSSFQLFRTEIGQSEATGPVVSDDALLVLCLQMGDDRGTLKFLVQQTAPPPNSTVRAMPPPTAVIVTQRTMNDDVRRTSGTGSAAGHHLRTESQSSKSSLSDALVYPELFGADASHEGSNRNSGSSLTRTKAQARRALPSAPPIDDLRSPTHAGSSSASQGFYQDRRSIASSADGSANESVARHSGLASESSPSVILTQRSSSISVNVPSAPGSSSSGGRRSSHVDDDKPRVDADAHVNRSLHAPSNGFGHRQERSDEGARDISRQQTLGQTSGLTLHNARSMDDLHRPAQPASEPSTMTTKAEVRKQAGMDRDGRYPAPAIMRPSTAAPAGPGARETGSSHRQYSSDAQSSVRPPVDSTSGLDPRMLQRNRSAQAAIPSSQQLVTHGPVRMSSTPQIRSPPIQNAYVGQGPVDPRFNAQPPHSAHAILARPSNVVARPQYSAPASYAGPPAYQTQSYGQATTRPMGPGYVNEFGARATASGPNFNTYHGHDPRLNASAMQGSLTPRPYSYHEQPALHQHPMYRPYGQPNYVAASAYRTREDPFTTRYFPASSSRQVSEFQMQAGRLEPGMTVQQTLRTHEVIRNQTSAGSPGQSYQTSHAHPPGPSYGPRDPRQPVQSNQYASMQAYSNTPPAAPPMHQRPSYQGSAVPNPHHAAPPRPQSFPSTQPQPVRSAHERQPVPPAGHAGAQVRAQPLNSSAGRLPMQQQQQQPRPHSHHEQAGSTVLTADVESHRRDPPVRTNASERSSGSSFSSQGSSQHRQPSNEDRNSRASIEESFSAPTSARSSQSEPVPAKATNTEHRPSYADTGRDLADDELENVRPLPKLPHSSATTPTDPSNPASASINSAVGGSARRSEDEDTLRAGEWAKLWRSLDPKADGTVSGTAISGSSGGDGDTVRAEQSTPEPSQPQARDALEHPRASDLSLPPEENGTFASFGSFDDDESESGTWAQPLDSDVHAPRLPLRLDAHGDQSSDDHGTLLPGEGTLLQASAQGGFNASNSPKRPELRLTIDPAAGPTLVTPNLSRGGNSPRPSSSHLSSALTSGGITRSNSFAGRDDDWAFRPPPEQLYENLDDFFPKHDLDKPLLDTAAVPESPMVSSPRSETAAGVASSTPTVTAPGPEQPVSHRSRLKKSIRLVAQDRKRFLDRFEKRPAAQGAETGNGLVRRRSTKLWGTKVVEMTPGQELATPPSAMSAESPSSDTSSQKPVFKWVKGDLIGKGTYGRVYLALNATTGEMIAVKQVELPRTASDREDSRQKGVVAALKSEIETLKDLDHPHIVSYLGFEETTTFLSIFLEYVPGGSVGSCLRKHGKFEEPTIKSFLHQILEGLAYLHSKGILHRDLKADNILVDFEGICKISDFGTVRRSDDIYGNVENMSLQGSIFWMAPEVVSLSKKGYSAKIDIWSLGCVVLEMFAGRRPWSDDEAVQAMFKIGAERKAPPIPADVKLSKQAAHFLKNCFEVDPAKRPTAQRLLDHVFSVPDEEWHFRQSALWRSLQR